MATIKDELRALDTLTPHSANYNQHGERQVQSLADAMRVVAFTAPIICREDGTILGGHARRLALLKLRAESYPEPEGVLPGWVVPCRVVECNRAEERKILVTDNPDPAQVAYDAEALAAILSELQETDSLEGTWYDDARLDALIGEMAGEAEAEPHSGGGGGSGPSAEEARATLAERFGVPPFSVLDARQGYWQDRKRAWLALGIESELGRGGGTWVESDTGSPLDRKNAYGGGRTQRPAVR